MKYLGKEMELIASHVNDNKHLYKDFDIENVADVKEEVVYFNSLHLKSADFDNPVSREKTTRQQYEIVTLKDSNGKEIQVSKITNNEELTISSAKELKETIFDNHINGEYYADLNTLLDHINKNVDIKDQMDKKTFFAELEKLNIAKDDFNFHDFKFASYEHSKNSRELENYFLNFRGKGEKSLTETTYVLLDLDGHEIFFDTKHDRFLDQAKGQRGLLRPEDVNIDKKEDKIELAEQSSTYIKETLSDYVHSFLPERIYDEHDR